MDRREIEGQERSTSRGGDGTMSGGDRGEKKIHSDIIVYTK